MNGQTTTTASAVEKTTMTEENNTGKKITRPEHTSAGWEPSVGFARQSREDLSPSVDLHAVYFAGHRIGK